MNERGRKILAMLCWSLFITVQEQAFADPELEDELINIYGSEEFISIASGYRQPVSKAPAVASLITAEDIKRVGALDIDDVLEMVPGLHVSHNYQGYNPIYVFRGIYSSFNPQVLMLINGVPITSLFYGNRSNSWVGMPVESIHRVEVIRGPGSAIYGADAFAGVINIITHDSESIRTNETGARLGSYATRELFGRFKAATPLGNLGFIYEYESSDGHDSVVGYDAQSYLDEITGTTASLAPGEVSLGKRALDLRLDLSRDNLQLRAGYQGRYGAGNGAGVVQALDPSNEFKSERFSADFLYRNQGDWHSDVDFSLSGSFLNATQLVEEDVHLFPAGTTGPFLTQDGMPLLGIFDDGVIGNPEIYERQSRINMNMIYSGLEDHSLSFGAGYFYGDIYRVEEEKNYCTDDASCAYILPRLAHSRLVDVSDTPFVFLREGDRKNHYVYIQDVFALANDWELTAGVRYDHYDDFGNTVNPRFALVWSTTNDLTTKFLYGEAFRAPAFVEMRAINNPSSLGNPDLKPETMKSFEVVFDYKIHYDLEAVFNSFYYEWDEIIQFVPDAEGGTSTAQNTGRQTGYGFEAEVSWAPVDFWNLSANFAYQKSTNRTDDRDVANAPGRQFYIKSLWQLAPDMDINLQLNWIMDRSREALDARPPVDDYVIADLTLRKRELAGSLDAALMIKNIFDEDAREPTPNGFPRPGLPEDLPLAGRTFVGEIRYQF